MVKTYKLKNPDLLKTENLQKNKNFPVTICKIRHLYMKPQTEEFLFFYLISKKW